MGNGTVELTANGGAGLVAAVAGGGRTLSCGTTAGDITGLVDGAAEAEAAAAAAADAELLLELVDDILVL